jgi:hypothetical protein
MPVAGMVAGAVPSVLFEQAVTTSNWSDKAVNADAPATFRNEIWNIPASLFFTKLCLIAL